MIDVQLGSSMEDLQETLFQRLTTNTYWAATSFFGLTFLNGLVHRRIGEFLDKLGREPGYTRELLLAPRGWGKTLLARVHFATRFLADPQNFTALFGAYDKDLASDNAKGFISFVTSDPAAEMFPRLVEPLRKYEKAFSGKSRDKVAWASIIPSNKPDPTVHITSTRGGSTGKHLGYIFVDDVIGLRESFSPTECKKALEWIKVTFNVGEHQTETPWLVVGTRYHYRDTYAMLFEESVGENFRVLAIPGYWDFVRDGKVERVSGWEKKFPASKMGDLVKIMTPKVFAAQIQQRPIQADEAIFKEEWLSFYTYGKTTNEIVNPKTGKVWDLSQLALIIVFDPALGTDEARARNAFVLVGIDPDEHQYVLHTFAQKCSIDTAVKHLVGTIIQYEPDVVAIEEVLFQALIRPALKKTLQSNLAIATRFRGVKPKGRSKELRILSLQPLLESGRLHMRPDQADLLEEMLGYPGARTRDILDALAYINDVRFTPRKTQPKDTYAILTAGRTGQRKARNRITGY